MLSAYFYLDEGDIHNLKLNDKIRIDNSWWNINRVIDYNANTEGLTKVELISVDSEQELAPFITNTGTTAPSPTTQGSAASVLQSMAISTNVALQGSNAAIYGQGNIVAQSVKGVIIGDNKTLNEDGLITPKINGAAVQSQTYVVNLSQVGTNDPTAIDLSNNIGVVTWIRTAAGEYLGTPTNPFDALYTYVMINQVEHDYQTSAYINTDGNNVVVTCRNSGHNHNDGILNNTTLEIRTY
jgi:hypothetical protein